MNLPEPGREPVIHKVAQGTPDQTVVGSRYEPQARDRATLSGSAGNPRAAHRMIDTRAPGGSQSR